MTILANSIGDTVTVDLGGLGGDNVTGTAEDRQGAPVPDARVKVINLSNGQEDVHKTGKDSEYDIGLDASDRDRVFVHVEWKDAADHWQVVTEIVELKGAPATAKEPNVSEARAEIQRLESQAFRLRQASSGINDAVVKLYGEIQSELYSYLNTVCELGDEARQRGEIDVPQFRVLAAEAAASPSRSR